MVVLGKSTGHWWRRPLSLLRERSVPGLPVTRSRTSPTPGRNPRQVPRKPYCATAVQLMTGRHHQIRCQLASIGCPIKGDLKYGARRSNPDGSISLHARQITFIHPTRKEPVTVTAPTPMEDM